jgi:hypothetical protein
MLLTVTGPECKNYASSPNGCVLWQVADPNLDVIAVVKGQPDKATELRLQSEEHVVTPSPISLLQPVSVGSTLQTVIRRRAAISCQ